MAPSTTPPRPSKASEAGFSLVEVLVTLAITVMIGVSLISALMAIAANGRRESVQTDYYESLRLAAHLFMQDARQAREADADPVWITLYTSSDYDDYIRYIFATWNGTEAGIADGGNLHRWVVEGGVLQSDDVVASDLVPPNGPVPRTKFTAVSSDTSKYAKAELVKTQMRGQGTQTRTRMDVWGLLR